VAAGKADLRGERRPGGVGAAVGEHVAHGIHVGTLLGQAAGTQVGLLRTVYVFRHDWHQGRIVRAEE
jgi:hypothetical protein